MGAEHRDDWAHQDRDPRASIPLATRRITRFIDQIDRATQPSTASGVEDVRIRNVATDLDEQFSVQRLPAKYQV